MRCFRTLMPARGLSSFLFVKSGTPTRTRAPTHTYSALHTHLFTLKSLPREQTDVYPLSWCATAIRVGTPSPTPRGPHPPAPCAHLEPPPQHAQHTTPTPLSTLHRARGACSHAH